MPPDPRPIPKPAVTEAGVLFTAFEPSGDDHAAIVIAELRRRRPRLPIYAWGGPKMKAAGATIIHGTGENAVMGVPGLGKILEHRSINADIARWLDRGLVGLHVPVDSPAANFPICKLAKARGVKVVHLVAPQVWAWGRWRIRKLRRLTDLVLCVLPFEEGWFSTQGVPARFIGHPLFGRPLDTAELDRAAKGFHPSRPRIALLPGSRPAEITNNFPLLLEVFERIKAAHPTAQGLVAATNERVRRRVSGMIHGGVNGAPKDLACLAGQTDAIVRWCDLALVVSGTVTLQIARHLKPMVIFYNSNPVLYHGIARWLLTTKYFTLPNLIAGHEIVPEFVPHFDGPGPIFRAADRLLADPAQMERQREELAKVLAKYDGFDAAAAAADAIEEFLDDPAAGSV